MSLGKDLKEADKQLEKTLTCDLETIINEKRKIIEERRKEFEALTPQQIQDSEMSFISRYEDKLKVLRYTPAKAYLSLVGLCLRLQKEININNFVRLKENSVNDKKIFSDSSSEKNPLLLNKEENDLEANIILASCQLNRAAYSIMFRYHFNDIQLPLFLASSVLKLDLGILEPFKINKWREYTKDQQVELIKEGSRFLLKILEDEFSNLPDPRFGDYPKKKIEYGEETYTRPTLLEDAKSRLDKIFKYASYLEELSFVLKEIGEIREASTLRTAVEPLLDKDRTLKCLIDENTKPDFYSNLIVAHATLAGLNADKEYLPLIGYASGNKVEFLLSIVEAYKKTVNDLAELLMVDVPGFKRMEQDHRKGLVEVIVKKVDNLSKIDYIAYMMDALAKLPFFGESINSLPHPLDFLELELLPFGIEDNFARDFSKALKNRVLHGQKVNDMLKQRTIDIKQEKGTFDLYGALEHYTKGITYAKALKIIIEKSLERKIRDFKIESYDEETFLRSQSISRNLLVYEEYAEGRFEEIEKIDFSKGDSKLIERYSKAYPDSFIYISGPLGVAWVLEPAFNFFARNPDSSEIEILLDKSEELQYENKLIDRLHFSFHEATHISQIGSRLIWRYLTLFYSVILSELALDKYDKGILDSEAFFSDTGILDTSQQLLNEINIDQEKGPRAGRTWRSNLIKWFNYVSFQGFGIGEKAELLREKGLMEGCILYDSNGKIVTSFASGPVKTFQMTKALKEIKKEKGKISDLADKLFEGIKELDMNESNKYKPPEERKDTRQELKKLVIKGKDTLKELSSMIETHAEVSGLYLTREAMKGMVREGLNEEHINKALDRKYKELAGVGKNALFVKEVYDQFKDAPEELERRLNEEGFTFNKVLNRYEDREKRIENLKLLGYDENNLSDAYDDIGSLNEKIERFNLEREEKISKNEFYRPVNPVWTEIQIKYRSNIPFFMSFVDKYGLKKASEIFLNSECMEDIKQYGET